MLCKCVIDELPRLDRSFVTGGFELFIRKIAFLPYKRDVLTESFETLISPSELNSQKLTICAPESSVRHHTPLDAEAFERWHAAYDVHARIAYGAARHEEPLQLQICEVTHYVLQKKSL